LLVTGPQLGLQLTRASLAEDADVIANGTGILAGEQGPRPHYAVDHGQPDVVLEKIQRALDPLPEVQAALLFGSRATGRARLDSDIDVAVLLDMSAAPTDASDRGRRLLGALALELAADRIDLVVLNEAPPALAFQILKYGRVAFERERSFLHRLRVRVYSQHSDFEPTERFFREQIKRRALAEARRG
jgi:uncharacterized protein